MHDHPHDPLHETWYWLGFVQPSESSSHSPGYRVLHIYPTTALISYLLVVCIVCSVHCHKVDMSVTEFTALPSLGALPHIPDDVTLPQFIFDSWHPTRPVNKNHNPVLIEDSTGRGVGFSEVCVGKAVHTQGPLISYHAVESPHVRPCE